MTQCIQVVFQNTYGSGVSRISARGVLKVRPHTKSGGGGGGGQSTSGPIYEKWGGGGGQFASGPIPLFGTQKTVTILTKGAGGLKHFTRARE